MKDKSNTFTRYFDVLCLVCTFQTLEGQSIAVARNLTKKVRTGITTLVSYIPESVQISVKDRIDQAKQYSDELIKSFEKVSRNYHAVVSEMLVYLCLWSIICQFFICILTCDYKAWKMPHMISKLTKMVLTLRLCSMKLINHAHNLWRRSCTLRDIQPLLFSVHVSWQCWNIIRIYDYYVTGWILWSDS